MEQTDGQEMTLLQKKRARLQAEQEKLQAMETAAERLPVAQLELKDATVAEQKAARELIKAREHRTALETEIRECKVLLGIPVRASSKPKDGAKQEAAQQPEAAPADGEKPTS